MHVHQCRIIKYFIMGSMCTNIAIPVMANMTDAADLIDIPFEQLMKMDVVITSASKQEEEAATVPSAIFVITAKDIERSGVTSIPEVLNIAPGIQASCINSSEWAVSSRGFNGRFSRYLLVLIDGRSIEKRFINGNHSDKIGENSDYRISYNRNDREGFDPVNTDVKEKKLAVTTLVDCVALGT